LQKSEAFSLRDSKGEAVMGYSDPLILRSLGASGFPGLPGVAQRSLEGKKMEKNRTDSGLHRWFIPAIRPGSALDSTHIMLSEIFSIFFMQHWG
jgi:hypothetical protein